MKEYQIELEALIFGATTGISAKEIHTIFMSHHEIDLSFDEIEACLNRIKKKYATSDYPFELVEIDHQFRFLSKPIFHEIIESHVKLAEQKKLSKSALETLAIIAYKQPCTKSEIEEIRGVNCEYSIHKLLDKELVSIIGRSDGPGRPILYGTSQMFMDFFGLRSIEDLPKYKDITSNKEEIGTIQDIGEEALKKLSEN